VPGSYEHSNEQRVIIFRYVTLCRLVDVYRRFGEAYCLHIQGRSASRATQTPLDPEDGGNMFLRKIGKILPDYMASHPGI
jgi:hypothetical protein